MVFRRVQFGPIVFLVYMNNLLPKAREHKAISILFADDTIILITSPNNIQFQSDINIVFGQLNKWFKGSFLSLNFDKIDFVQFINKSTGTSDIEITYEDKQIHTAFEKKFLGPLVNNTLYWKTHTEYTKSKLSSACAMHSVKPYVSLNTLQMIYYCYFHSVMTYGLLFWGHFADGITIFKFAKVDY